METKDRTSKRYFWNSNAQTHANAIFSHVVLSSGLASTFTLSLDAMLIWLLELDREMAIWVVVTSCLCWLVMWQVTFWSTTIWYFRLVESQVIQGTGGAGGKEKIKREVYYRAGKGWKLDKNASGVGEVSTQVDTSGEG